MIAKISTGKSLFGVLAYNQKKIDEDKGKILFTNFIEEPKDGLFNVFKIEKDFTEYMPGKFKTKNYAFHVSLNPHPKDKISDETYTEIANEYMRELGYGEQPYIVFKHEDIDRHHIHIVSVNVDTAGNKIDDSFIKVRSKRITNNLEDKYGLLKSENIRDRKMEIDFHSVPDIKQKLSNILKEINDGYSYLSFNEYNSLLQEFNIRAELITGEKNGNRYNGIIYKTTDKNGKVVGNPYKSSRIGKFCGYNAIEKNIEKSVKKLKNGNYKSEMQKKITVILMDSKSLKDFEKKLGKERIGIIIRKNEQGRIYGITFIDFENKIVLNGSRLSKELSANSINNLFSQSGKGYAKEIINSEKENTVQPEKNNEQNLNENYSSGIGLFDFLVEPNNEEFEENLIRKKRKRKKKGLN